MGGEHVTSLGEMRNAYKICWKTWQ